MHNSNTETDLPEKAEQTEQTEQPEQTEQTEQQQPNDIQTIFQSKLKLLDRILSEIDTQVKNRNHMQNLFIRELSDLISEINTQIDQYKAQAKQADMTFLSRMYVFTTQLELRKIEENTRSWNDIQVLLRERREVERERMEIERRLKELGKDA